MSFSELFLLFTLTNILIIFYEPFSGIGANANANALPTNCVQKCNQTLKNRQQCYERCEEMAHNNGFQNISEAGLATGYKLYGYPYSANTRRVLAVLHEKNLSYEPVTVDLRSGEQKKPPFLAFNPFGLVPVFLDGHLKLTESRAISEYIAYIHISRGTKLVNYKNHKKMGTIIMWMTVESFEFDPPASLLTLEQCIKPMFGLKTDYKLVNATEPILEKVLDIYEMRLKKSKYLAGKRFTMADLYHLPNLEYLMTTPTSRLFKNRPSVNRWLTEIMARPAWKKACDAKLWWGDKKKKNNV